MTLHWPNIRIEVEGENLGLVGTLTMMRPAAIWRVFDSAEHVEPKEVEPKIRSMKIISVDMKAG